MKAVFVLFDTLNRRFLPPYSDDTVRAPAFERLNEQTTRFDNCYIGSMPCMPARRDLHTGRLNFLHRSWGPIEPFDDSMPEILKNNEIYTHLITDHFHYWEDGGATYLSRYDTYDIVRGNAADAWAPALGTSVESIPESLNDRLSQGAGPQSWANRNRARAEADQPMPTCFAHAESFLREHAGDDGWFLQLETFDPHEPFVVPERFASLYDDRWDGPSFDWPPYRAVQEHETSEAIAHVRSLYAANVTMCDEYLGRVLDLFDRHGLWDDTMLIVGTDHGLLLGEHGWWAKGHMPNYNEIAHIPLYIWDPRSRARGARSSLVQLHDLAPTLLEHFDVPVPPDMTGRSLQGTIESDTPVRSEALFGLFGAHVNVTDGRYVYMRAPGRENAPLHQYTLMPTTHGRHRAFIPLDELRSAELTGPLSFTKGAPVLRIPSSGWYGKDYSRFGDLLFDLQDDPGQLHPIDCSGTEGARIEAAMTERLLRAMRLHAAPEEQFARLRL